MKSLGTKWANNNMVIPCSEKVEPGYFFGNKGGRIRAETRFRVGLDFDITMMIKPRNLTGILAAVRGRRDYLVLYMDNGAIQFTVDNGRGPITAVFKPSDKHEFCNGQVRVALALLLSLLASSVARDPRRQGQERGHPLGEQDLRTAWDRGPRSQLHRHQQPPLPWWTSKVIISFFQFFGRNN